MFTIALIGLIGGLITGVSPCVLPMLPIIFFAGGAVGSGASGPASPASAAQVAGVDVLEKAPPARTTTWVRPLLIIAGLVTSFSLFTLAGTALLSALGLPDSFLRDVGLVVLVVVGLGLIFPAIGHWIEKPFYRLPKVNNPDSNAFLFGMGLGTLYVPCAGPVLAAITVAGATGHVGVRTIVLTISFAIGAALPLLFFAAAGAKASERIKSYRSKARGFRIAGGMLMIALAVGFAFDLPATVQRALPNYTSGLERKVADSDAVQGALAPLANADNKDLAKCRPGASDLASCGVAPDITGTQRWFNTPGGSRVSLDNLHGKVVLIDFFAYSCINCQRDAPHLVSWYDRYRDAGLEIVGIHSPEFTFERSAGNLGEAIDKEGLEYPIAQDNNLSTWTNYRNRYWPAKYLIDADGTVRAIRFGEGGYDTTEQQIRTLLRDANPGGKLPPPVDRVSTDAAPKSGAVTQETYFGYSRSTNYAGDPKQVLNKQLAYTLNENQPRNSYSLGGTWTQQTQFAEADKGATARLHFEAGKVFHVLAGTGTVTVDVPGQKTRTVEVKGTPDLYEVYNGPAAGGVMTLRYSPGLKVYTFSFG